MKLIKLFEYYEELLEAVRFGNKEMRMVLADSRDIFVGIEYEFVIGDDYAYNVNDVRQYLIDFGISPYIIEAIKTEHFHRGIEVITTPIVLKDALKLMEVMHKFINKYGSTTSDTGMHVNVSIKNEKFNASNIDKVKLVAFLDEMHFTSDKKYQKRKYVDKQLMGKIDIMNFVHRIRNEIKVFDNPNIPEDHPFNDIDFLVKYIKIFLEDQLPDEKYVTINFKHMLKAESIDNGRRIEFRYFGGSGYHKKTKSLEFDIVQAIYMLKAAFDPEFGREEYDTKVISLIDRALDAANLPPIRDMIKRLEAGDGYLQKPDRLKDKRIAYIAHKPELLKNIEDEEIQDAALIRNGKVIQYIKNPTEEQQLMAITNEGNYIKYIDNPSYDVRIAAINQNPFSIQYINNPTEIERRIALSLNGEVIQFIDNPKEMEMVVAVTSSQNAIKYINDPSEYIQLQSIGFSVMSYRLIDNPTQEVSNRVAQRSGVMLQYIENPTERQMLDAIRDNGMALQYVEDPTEDMMIKALTNSGTAIRFIRNPSKELQVIAIDNTVGAYDYIDVPDPVILLMGVNGGLSKYVEINGMDDTVIEGIKDSGADIYNGLMEVNTFTDVEDMVEDYGNDIAKYAVEVVGGGSGNSDDMHDYFTADDMSYKLSAEQVYKLEKYTKNKYPDDEDPADWFTTLTDNDDDLIGWSGLQMLASDAYSDGASSDAWNSLNAAYEEGIDDRFLFKPDKLIWGTKISLWMNLSDLESDIKNMVFDDFDELYAYIEDELISDLEFKVEQPYNGWDGFNDEYFKTEVDALLKDIEL